MAKKVEDIKALKQSKWGLRSYNDVMKDRVY